MTGKDIEEKPARDLSPFGGKLAMTVAVTFVVAGALSLGAHPLPLRLLAALLGFGAVLGALWSTGYEVPAFVAVIAFLLFTTPLTDKFIGASGSAIPDWEPSLVVSAFMFVVLFVIRFVRRRIAPQPN